MALSRQLAALGKTAGFFALAFGAVGVAAGLITGGPVWTLAGGYAALGGMSGTFTGLMVARSESGRQIEEVPTWRMAGWGIVGGAAPAGLFAVLGLAFGTSASALLPLLGLGGIGGLLGGAISASASAAAKRNQLEAGATSPGLLDQGDLERGPSRGDG